MHNIDKSDGHFATVDGVKLHYYDVGDGPPLIMLHGGGPGASGWSNFGANLKDLSQELRIILVDQPGYGESSKTKPVDEARSQLAARTVIGLMDKLDIERANVLGNSFGGRTALNMALNWSDRVDRLVLMGPAGGSLNIYTPEPTEGMKHLHGFFADPGPSVEKMRALVDAFVYDKSLVDDTLVAARYEAAIEPETREFYVTFLSKPDKREPELWRELEHIEHKTLLLWGRDDRTNPFEGGLFMLKRMPDARLHIFPQCGHWVQMEKRDEFNRVVRSFVTG